MHRGIQLPLITKRNKPQFHQQTPTNISHGNWEYTSRPIVEMETVSLQMYSSVFLQTSFLVKSNNDGPSVWTLVFF